MLSAHTRRLTTCLALAAVACLTLGCGEETPPEGPMVGKRAIDLAPEVEFWVNGSELDITTLRNQVVLLYFWHPRDGKSLATLPAVQKLAAEFADAGLVTVGICVLDGPADIEPLIREHKIGFRIALDCDADLHVRYRIDKTGTPYCYLVDTHHVVAWEGPPGSLTARRVAKLLPTDLR